MSGYEDQAEKIMVKNMEKIINFIVAIGVRTIGDGLYSEGLINEEDYQYLGLDRIPQNKSRKLVQGVTAKVRVSSKKFDKFLKVLDDHADEDMKELVSSLQIQSEFLKK